MKSSFSFITAGLALTLALQGCQDDDFDTMLPQGSGRVMNIAGSIQQENETRANSSGFVDGDRMGVYVVNYSLSGGETPGVLQAYNNQASNVSATYNEEENQWTLASTIYWLDNVTPADIYGYYPFKATITDVNNYSFEVESNQSVAVEGEMSNYEASDFLWAKSTRVEPTDQKVILQYNHIMAGIAVTLKAGTDMTETELSKLPKIVALENVTRSATIDLSSGVVTPLNKEDGITILNQEESGDFRGVTIPQTVDAGTPLITVSLDEVSYHLTHTEQLNLRSGQLYNFTITINKRAESGDYELTLSDATITPWVNDQSSHSFETRSYVVVDCPEYGKLSEAIAAAGIDYSTVRNLKINGELTDDDFTFMREDMPQLVSLNLYNVKLRHCMSNYDYYDPQYADDYFPANGLNNMEYLRYLVLPQVITYIGSNAFSKLNLRGTLFVPNTLKSANGFSQMGDEFEMNIPLYIEEIAGDAYWGCKAKIDFKLPSTLKKIGGGAFYNATNVYGTFALPAGVTEIGDYAFDNMGTNMEGDIEIPVGVTTIGYSTFKINFKNGTRLYFNEGLETIEHDAFSWLKIWNTVVFPKSLKEFSRRNNGGDGAFAYVQFKNGMQLPDGLSYLEDGAFGSSSLSGKITLPTGLKSIGVATFENTQITELEIPDNYEEIRTSAFKSCSELKTVTIGKYVNYIGSGAFANCPQLATVVCLAPTPPTAPSAFEDLEWDKVILEVPESVLNLYRTADGWNNFRNITPHKELAINIPKIECLNTSMTVSGILRTQGAWSVAECPSWCHVSQTSGTTLKTELTVTVEALPNGDANREGEIVFRLEDVDYRVSIPVSQINYEYAEGEAIVLQQASAGAREIPIFIVGDGFSAPEIASGQYLEIMKEQMEHFFNIEPYRTYRNYFTVLTSIAVSPESGITTLSESKATRFSSDVDGYGSYYCNQDDLRSFMCQTSTLLSESMDRTLVIFVVNNNSNRGSASVFDTEPAIAICPLSDDSYPYDQRGLVQHYAGGIAFGKLGPENISHYEFLKLCGCPGCQDYGTYNSAKERGWYQNISISGKMKEVPWAHLIFDENYSDIVDVYEGGYRHSRGVYRSENMSCMATFIAYYNTISRETIVRRIMSLADRSFDFDDFVSNDSRDGMIE